MTAFDELKARYAAEYEVHAEAGQELVAKGRYDEAERHHHAARLLAWSLVAEEDDKPPQDKNRRDWCYCVDCLLAQFRKVT